MTDPSDKILARAAWRLIPFMSLMYVVSFLDRVNISFAALTMNRDLGFSPEAFGFGAGSTRAIAGAGDERPAVRGDQSGGHAATAARTRPRCSR